jgi:hypothetical protein
MKETATTNDGALASSCTAEAIPQVRNFDHLQTGDLLLFHDTHSFCSSAFNFLSKCIDRCTNSKYSHIGIVLRNPTYLNPVLDDGVYMWESGIETFGDAEDDKIKLGVQISRLDKVLDAYPGDVYVRHLRCARDDAFFQNLCQAHARVHDVPYDLSPLDWLSAAKREHDNDLWRLFADNRFRTMRRMWCSALVAYVYVRLGLLSRDTMWTLAAPKDFGTEQPPHKRRLHFLPTGQLSDEKILAQ